MDINKIGKFISEKRKEKKLTQEQLAEAKKETKKAEELLLELKKQEEEKDKIIFSSIYFFTFIILFLFLGICFIVSNCLEEGPIQLAIILLSLLLFLIACLYALKVESLVGYHECKLCHHKHKPSYKEVLWAMHIGSTRYLKCPKCNKKSWNKKIIKK